MRRQRKQGSKIEVFRLGKRIGLASVQKIKYVPYSQLETLLSEFVSQSGFKKLEDWLEKIYRMYGKKANNLYLYKVTLEKVC